MAKKEKITNAQLDQEVNSIKEQLAEEEKVLMILPEEKDATYVRVTIGGHTMNIQCGVPVHVPKSVYLVLQNKAKLLAENKALEKKLTDGDGINADEGIDL